jgi:hypothetical protein
MRRRLRSRQVIEDEGKRKPRFPLADEKNASGGILRGPLNTDLGPVDCTHQGAAGVGA